jgi:hypothetical protein
MTIHTVANLIQVSALTMDHQQIKQLINASTGIRRELAQDPMMPKD